VCKSPQLKSTRLYALPSCTPLYVLTHPIIHRSAGSPLLSTVKQRVAGIKKEYDELDTVWFMAKSLFNRYPFDLPTETFSYEVFK